LAKKTVNTIKEVLNEKGAYPFTTKWTEEHVMGREKNHVSLPTKTKVM
jgi:hypothetical protein